ncbi:MAG TPA: hypothetical protein VK590_12930, partial [Saprospiraceae bacterium]|nr:hypothetical protein [Saprospiraceae bacterium]
LSFYKGLHPLLIYFGPSGLININCQSLNLAYKALRGTIYQPGVKPLDNNQSKYKRWRCAISFEISIPNYSNPF